jgi:hypothetical protein
MKLNLSKDKLRPRGSYEVSTKTRFLIGEMGFCRYGGAI